MKRVKRKQRYIEDKKIGATKVIIDVDPVEVETTALVVRRPPAQARPGSDSKLGPTRTARTSLDSKRVPARTNSDSVPDPTGRLDVLAYRLAAGYALPWAERVMNIPGLANVLEPWAEVAISEALPPVNIFNAAPKPRRRLK